MCGQAFFPVLLDESRLRCLLVKSQVVGATCCQLAGRARRDGPRPRPGHPGRLPGLRGRPPRSGRRPVAARPPVPRPPGRAPPCRHRPAPTRAMPKAGTRPGPAPVPEPSAPAGPGPVSPARYALVPGPSAPAGPGPVSREGRAPAPGASVPPACRPPPSPLTRIAAPSASGLGRCGGSGVGMMT